MSQLPPIGQSLSQDQSTANQNGGLRGLDIDDFMTLMIAELQNQDPLDPLNNAEILQQISQIREIGATDRLTETLEAVLLGQNVGSATALIGKQISGLSDAGKQVSGIVDRVTISEGVPKLHVGLQEVSLNNVREIVDGEEEDEA